MNTYRLIVSSLGYADYAVTLRAKSKQQALGTNNRLKAIMAWERHNDVDLDSCTTLPAVRCELVTHEEINDKVYEDGGPLPTFFIPRP